MKNHQEIRRDRKIFVLLRGSNVLISLLAMHCKISVISVIVDNYFLLIRNVGTVPPPAVTFASSFEESRVNAAPTLPLKSNGSRSTSCSAKLMFPSDVNAGKTSRAVGTRSWTR